MNRDEPNPASAKQPAEGSRENVNVGASDDRTRDRQRGNKDFEPKTDLPGKTDSGPEPDVHGRELPPQK